MHSVIAHWVVRPEHVPAFLETMRAHIEATRRSEPGCLRFDLCRDKSDARAFWLYEVYRDDAALAAHAASPTLAALRAKIPDWVESRELVNATLLMPDAA